MHVCECACVGGVIMILIIIMEWFPRVRVYPHKHAHKHACTGMYACVRVCVRASVFA